MQTDNLWQSRVVQTIVTIVVAIVALIAALILVPPFARDIGVFEKHVDYATAAAAFVIVFIAARRLKALNQKPAVKNETPRKKR